MFPTDKLSTFSKQLLRGVAPLTLVCSSFILAAETEGLNPAQHGTGAVASVDTYLSLSKTDPIVLTFGGIVLSVVFLVAWLLRERSQARKLSALSEERNGLTLQLRQLSTHTELALDAAQVGQLAIEVKTQQLAVDERFRSLYGLPADAPLGFAELTEYLHPDDVETMLSFRAQAYGPEAVADGTRLETQYRIIPKDTGEPHWLKVTARRVEINGAPWVIGCIYSVNDEVKARLQYEEVYRNLAAACEFGGLYLMDTNLSAGVSRYIIRPEDGGEYPLAGFDLLKAVPVEYHQTLLKAHNSKGVTVEFPLRYPDWPEARWMRDQVVETWTDECGDQHAIILSQDIHEEYQQRLDLERSQKLVTAASMSAGISLIDHNLSTHTAEWKFLPTSEAPSPYVEERLLQSTTEPYRDAIAKAYANLGEKVQFPLTVAETGQTKWVENQVFDRWVDINGERHQLVVSKDMTVEHAKQQELERALAAVDLVTRNGGIALMRHDLLSDVLEVNDVFRELFLFPQEDYPVIRFEQFLDRVPEGDLEQRRQSIEKITKSHETYHGVVMFVRPDGSNFWCKLQLNTRFEQDKPVEVLGSFVDITEQRQMARQLRVSLNEREAAVKALEQKQQAQQQMFAVIGHELRTPAAALNMMLDAQASGSKGPYSGEIRETASHLLAVLDDLRAVIEPELLTKRAQEFGSPLQIVESTLVPLRDRLKTAGLWVHLQSDTQSAEQYLFDSRGLRQIAINLIKNAALHSGASELQVRLKVTHNSGTSPVLDVEFCDNGKGIPETQWQQIFEPFQRGDTEQDGTGLGLHICRELMRASGGELLLGRSPAGGCCFSVTLPMMVAAPDHQPKVTATASLENRRVLLAEDNLMLRMLSEQILEGLGAKSVSAVDGREALEYVARQEFDLLLTDIFMPRVDGYALVSELRQQGFNKPIIGITAAMVGDESQRLLAAGADRVIAKPITKEKLLKAWSEVEAERQSQSAG